jgi:predicted nucleic acid-binding protein
MPDRTVIVNTSPLLYLNMIGSCDLLHKIYEEVLTPPAVVDELRQGAEKGINVPDPTSSPWIHIQSVSLPMSLPESIDLGQGETEVILLGMEYKDSLLILDDQLARRIAGLCNLTFTGTLGVLLKAKQLGHVTSIHGLIQRLRSKGMWLDDSLVRAVLSMAKE